MIRREDVRGKFHLSDGREVLFCAVRDSVWTRRAGEILMAAVILMLGLFLLASGCGRGSRAGSGPAMPPGGAAVLALRGS
jgi:hypothetical protein